MKSVTRIFKSISTLFSSVKIIVMIAFLGLIFSTSETSAQITIDGDPTDWGIYLSNPSTTVKARFVDPIDNTDNIWTQGSSDISPITGWHWATNGSNDKNNIQNAGFALIGSRVYFFADRHANNGDAAVGFWLLQSPVAQVAGGTFSGVHTDGDLLLISHFVNGGGVAEIQAYRWVGSNPGALNQTAIPLNIANLYAAVNATTTPASPWPYTPKSGPDNIYPTNTFFEGFVDLAAVGIEISVCLGSFVAETRNSQSLTASLEDLVIGRFGAQPVTQTVTGSSICSSAPGTGTVSMAGSEVGVSYQLKLSSDTTVNIQAPKAGTGGALVWTGVPGGSYLIVGTNTTSLCYEIIGNPTLVSVIAAPTVTVNSPARCSNGPAATITATPSPAGTYTYVWTVPPTATNPGDVASFSATVAGTYSVTITNAATCTGSNSGVLTVNPAPDVNDPADQVKCNGASTNAVSFTSSVPGTTFAWTNDQPGIGLAANGSGNIAAFTAVNTGTSPVIATITVTPSTSLCTGDPITFTITVNPTPTVDQPGNQTECNGAATTAITFTGTGTSYNWTNNNIAIGLGASGSGNIPSFIATNATAAPIVGTITVTPVYVNGGVTCTGASKTFTITVNPTGQVNQPGNQVVCNGAQTTLITFTGTATTYNWTNDNTSIGLGASGTGNIAAFAGINTGTSPVIATITVTPISTSGGISCSGPSKTFTITVNPTGQVNQPGSQTLCNGSNTTAITFATNNTGGTTTYAWTNNTTSIGLAASGNGNILSFVAVNTGTSPVIATITVTPTFSNGGANCPGASKTFTITVNPTGQVNQPGNQTLCNGSSTTTVVFTSNNSGGTVTYAWTNNTTSIGLAASGNGDIASFTAINTGTSPVIATITVTPTFTNDGVSCPGTSKTFTITVNPTGQVNQPANQTLCNGSSTTTVVFTSNNTGGTTTYAWTNNTTSIGLAASGNGNIPSFVAVNTGTSPVIATITVTPTFSNGGVNCPGASKTFTITVNPTGQVNQPGSQTLCNGSSTTTVIFTSNNSGGTTTYAWTNNTTSIGLA
ncbi:MAG: PKD-like domain-containing protein, partial [Ferruginibacter sp.]